MTRLCTERYHPLHAFRSIECGRKARWEWLTLKVAAPYPVPVCGVHVRWYRARPSQYIVREVAA